MNMSKSLSNYRSLALVFLLSGLCSTFSQAQSDSSFVAPKFVKMYIGDSGSSAYFPNDDTLSVTMELSEDSSKVYTAEVPSGNFHYGIILVEFNNFTIDTKEDREQILVSYLDYLKQTFSIVSSAGYGLGHTLARDESVEGVIDFWLDEDGDEWSINGWVRPDGLAVMFIYGPEEYPNYSLSKFFFNGLEF